MLEGRSGYDIPEFGLYHCPQVAGRVMAKLDHLAGLTFKNYYHAASNLSCWDSHELISSLHLK